MTDTVDLGSFADGEVPEPLVYAFLDAAGDPIDLTGYTATFSLKVGDADAQTLPATVSTPLEGEVTHTWLDGELERQGSYGRVRAEFVVTNGTNTYVSLKMTGHVRRTVYVAP